MSESSKRKDPHWEPDWLSRPHDSYARLLLGDPRRAEIFIRERLSPNIVSLLAEAPLEVVPGEFISKGLQHKHADVLLKVPTIMEDDPHLYVLVEAKSAPDRNVALQVHEYHQEIWAYLDRKAQSDTGKKPGSRPPIVTILLYNGRTPWKNMPKSYEEWLDRGRHPFLARPPGLEFIPFNVNAIPTHELSRDGILRAGLALMQRPAAEKLRPVLGALSPNSGLTYPSGCYILHVYAEEVRDQVTAMLPRVPNGRGKGVGTIAASLLRDGRAQGRAQGIVKGRAEGEARGIIKGRAEGQAAMLIRQIRRRFGRVPRAVQSQVSRASPKQLAQWADEVFDAPSLQEMFGNTRSS